MNYLATKVGRGFKLIGFILIYQLSALFFNFINTTTPAATTRALLINGTIASLFTLGLVIWRYHRQLRQNNPFHFHRHPITLRSIIELVLLIVIMLIIQSVWTWTITSHLLSEPDNQKTVEAMLKQSFLLNYIYGGIIAPIFEEYIFRGIFFNYFFKLTHGRLSRFCGILVCGLVFGFAHTLSFDGNWLFYSALGWVLAFTYVHFKDIKYSIAIHMFNNLI
ncbi:CPBP family intramembrane metalloprotease [Nicoliella spurrieriana]|uniref:CPBP family intramembrane metalloprotease n=1 Tax=Nicoliella spurrieriana TaxID=2925830 RepID=A0A976X593_9LACO|nr:type II CAAX endopeptidase family protein [Nicoliella spurrieriana]UQS86297.1 CPBP family intramembrane metalloprotease [Nicoliella spurrieriana]